MALNTGIQSLDAGAPELRLEGEQQAGGVYQQGSEVKNALAVWANMGPEDRAGFEGFLDFFRSGVWRDQIQGMRQMESNRGTAAQGGRIGLRRGRVVEPGGYGGHLGHHQAPSAPSTGGGGGGGQEYRGGETYMAPRVTYTTPTVSTTAAHEDAYTPMTTIEALRAAREDASRTDLVSPIGDLIKAETKAPLEYSTIDDIGYDYPDYPAPIDTPKDMTRTEEILASEDINIDRGPTDYEWEAAPGKESMKGPIYTGTEDAETRAEMDLEWALKFGLLEKDPITGDTREGPNVRDAEGNIVPRDRITTTGITGGTTGDTGAVPLISDLVSTTTAADTGGTTFQESVEAQKAANLAASPGLPFEHYYVGGKPTTEQTAFMRASGAAPSMVGLKQYASRGGRAGYDRGGIANLRQPFILGGIGKKLKKLVKSDIGKAALIAGLGYYLTPGAGLTGAGSKGAWWKNLLLGTPGVGGGATDIRKGGIWPWIKKHPVASILGLSTTGGLLAGEEDDDLTADFDRGEGIDIPALRREIEKKNLARSKYPFMPTDYYAAQGGRAGYAGGRSVREAALAQLYGLNENEEEVKAQEGGLMDLGGMEKDYRDDGGFVPLGGEEKADDVPARLSKNEFVFTADAVRAAGGGDVDAGAEVMENGGRISDESQGREGAQGMFDNAQRLQNRII